MLHIDTCVAEARTLHPSSEGWFATFRKEPGLKPLQQLHQMSSLDAVVRALDKAPNAYLSQASFVKPRRLVSAFKSINCAFVDIDCYSDKPNSPKVEPTDAFIQALLENATAAGIPEPSYVTRSGRGVYCKWIFDRPITAYQLAKWKALQDVLTPLYTAFGVDAAARDAARVLRVVGSSHSEAGKQVCIALNNHSVHSFDGLCRAAEAVDRAQLIWPSAAGRQAAAAEVAQKVGQRRKITKSSARRSELLLAAGGDLGVLEQYAALHEPVMLRRGTRDHLNWSRFVDLRRLAELRGGIHAGSRDMMLFWMGVCLGHAGVIDSTNLVTEIGQLVGAFDKDPDGTAFDPVSEQSMKSLGDRLRAREAGESIYFHGIKYDPLYTASNDHLIDVLDISREEQAQLATIIDGQEKLRRSDEKVEGRAERREARLEWRGLARELAAKAEAAGETRYVSKIARQVGVDRRQVSRLLAGELERDPERIETRGRKRHANNCPRLVVFWRKGKDSRSVWIAPGEDEREAIAAARARLAAAAEARRQRMRAAAASPGSGGRVGARHGFGRSLNAAGAPRNPTTAPTNPSPASLSKTLAPNLRPLAPSLGGTPKRVVFSITRGERPGVETGFQARENQGEIGLKQAGAPQTIAFEGWSEGSARSGQGGKPKAPPSPPSFTRLMAFARGHGLGPTVSRGAKPAGPSKTTSHPSPLVTLEVAKRAASLTSADLIAGTPLASFAHDPARLRAEVSRLLNRAPGAANAEVLRRQQEEAAARQRQVAATASRFRQAFSKPSSPHAHQNSVGSEPPIGPPSHLEDPAHGNES